MLCDDWRVLRRRSFTHALHSAHPSPLGRTVNISAAAGGPGTAHRPGSRFKRRARLARLLAGPPGNKALGGNICTLSPGGSQPSPAPRPLRCTETEDAPIRGRLWHLCGLKGEIRRWVACRTGRRGGLISHHLTFRRSIDRPHMSLSGFWSAGSSEDNATRFIIQPAVSNEPSPKTQIHTHTHRKHSPESFALAQGGGWSWLEVSGRGKPSAAAATVTCSGETVNPWQRSCQSKPGGSFCTRGWWHHQLPATVGGGWGPTHDGAPVGRPAVTQVHSKACLLKRPLKAWPGCFCKRAQSDEWMLKASCPWGNVLHPDVPSWVFLSDLRPWA